METTRKRRGRPAGEALLDEEQIKRVARAQMAELGTAGLSLRGIARTLGVTAPALYNYFPRLDDLITALIVDAFTGLAAAMNEAADRALATSPHTQKIRDAIEAMGLAYRAWAIAHSTQFQLIYGNPIPGYVAPAEVTVPLASLPLERMIALFRAGFDEGLLRVPPACAPLPPAVSAFQSERFGEQLAPEQLSLIVSSWSRLHGMVMLEIFGHLEPVVGDCAAYGAHEMHAWLETISA